MSTERAVGRDHETAEIAAFLDAAKRGYRELVVEGEVGVGKSTLLFEAREAATERGFTVLCAQPLESETALGFAALIDLLHSVPADVFDALPSPQCRAVAVALLREEPGETPPDPSSQAAAVLGVLRMLSERGPVLLSIDDLPLLDAPTARVLAYALRRLGPEPIGLMTAVRSKWSGDAPALPILEARGRAAAERLRLGPVSLGAARELIARETGMALNRQLLLQIFKTAGGNPLFVLELARVLAQGELPAALEDLRLPTTLESLVREHLAAVPSDVSRVLLTAALASQPTRELLVDIGEQASVEEALHHAVQAGIVELRSGLVTFVHPLMRSALIQEAGPGEIREAHRRLASASIHSEERARHLALASDSPDPSVAQRLEQAALSAEARGACEIAAELAELAAKLTPTDQPGAVRRRLVLAAECRFDALDPDSAKHLVEGVIASCPAGLERADARMKLVKYLRYQGAPTAVWRLKLNDALHDAGDDGPTVAAIRLDLALTEANAGNLDASWEQGQIAARLAAETADVALQARVYAGMAYLAFQRGEGVRADLIEAGLVSAAQPRHTPPEVRPQIVVGHILHWSDDFEGARRLYEAEYARIKAEGAETELPMLVWGLAEVEAWTGHWSRAEVLIEEGYRASLATDNLAGTGIACAVRACLLGYRGQVSEARTEAARAIDIAKAIQVPLVQVFASQAVGMIALSVGDAAEAESALAPLVQMVRMTGVVEPGVLRFMPDAIEAMVRLGHLDAAAELLDPFEERAHALGRRWALATSGRCRSLLLAAGGQVEHALECLAGALDVHEALGMPFEHARTLSVLGEIHRRARHKREAVGALNSAVELFEDLGAPVWAERARSELNRVGVRRRSSSSPDTLTVAEQRVVAAAAAGRTNAEIAGELSMGVRTVETHLTRAYRKLGVRSRTELAYALPRAERSA